MRLFKLLIVVISFPFLAYEQTTPQSIVVRSSKNVPRAGQSRPSRISERVAAQAQADGNVAVIIVLSNQPHRAYVQWAESASDFRKKANAAELKRRTASGNPERLQAATERDSAVLEHRRLAMQAIKSAIGADQQAVTKLLIEVGAQHVHAYWATSAIAAHIPASALPTLEASPLVDHVALDEQQQIQLVSCF